MPSSRKEKPSSKRPADRSKRSAVDAPTPPSPPKRSPSSLDEGLAAMAQEPVVNEQQAPSELQMTERLSGSDDEDTITPEVAAEYAPQHETQDSVESLPDDSDDHETSNPIFEKPTSHPLDEEITQQEMEEAVGHEPIMQTLPTFSADISFSAGQDPAFVQRVKDYQIHFERARAELAKAVVGQHEVINNLLEALVANGHVLVEGLPGIAKTLLVRSMARVTGCEFKRIQFTPDLLPTDIVGITTYEEGKGFYTIKGPIFANFALADEINRAPPKVQSALLEAMQEKQVTIGNQTFPLPQPFFVMATQNPVENIGTYPLPEAQVDRFLFKVLMGYLEPADEILVMHRNMTLNKFEDLKLEPVLTPELIVAIQKEVKNIYLDPKVERYIVRIVEASRHPDRYGITKGKFVAYGGSPRSTIALFIASKARALVLGRTYVTPHDVKVKAHDVLRHRIILNYEGQAEGVSPDAVVDELLAKVPIAER